MTSKEIQVEIEKAEKIEEEAHERAIALRVCLRGQLKLEAQSAEADAAVAALLGAGKPS